MTGGTLVVTRMEKLHARIKRRFEELGFTNVAVTSKEKDGLNFDISELKPRLVIISSSFYEAGTPYMMGRMLKDFPKLRIAPISLLPYSDKVAAWFRWYGVKSYVNLCEGYEEFHKGLQDIRQGKEYIAPRVQRLLEESAEWRSPNAHTPKRQKEVLVLACNGFSPLEIGDCLHISKRTAEGHLNALYNTFCVHTREELISNAFYLGVVIREDLCFRRKSRQPDSLPMWAVINQRAGNHDPPRVPA
ncbi:MAG: LuxR C-terminal-related transcriptional regulator [Treponema sp.]|jgi:DNA-binding NarL/FixJ family response regulator|nr:LuxR C-terminal-related transcriptional regulator [Treponema sp.]